MDAKKFQSRPATRNVTCNVVKEISVPDEVSFPVALGLWKPTPIEERENEPEENIDDNKLEAEYLKPEEANIDEQTGHETPPEVVLSEETLISDTHVMNFRKSKKKLQRR